MLWGWTGHEARFPKIGATVTSWLRNTKQKYKDDAFSVRAIYTQSYHEAAGQSDVDKIPKTV